MKKSNLRLAKEAAIEAEKLLKDEIDKEGNKPSEVLRGARQMIKTCRKLINKAEEG